MTPPRAPEAEPIPAEANDNAETWALLFDHAIRVVAAAMAQDDTPNPTPEAAE